MGISKLYIHYKALDAVVKLWLQEGAHKEHSIKSSRLESNPRAHEIAAALYLTCLLAWANVDIYFSITSPRDKTDHIGFMGENLEIAWFSRALNVTGH